MGSDRVCPRLPAADALAFGACPALSGTLPKGANAGADPAASRGQGRHVCDAKNATYVILRTPYM